MPQTYLKYASALYGAERQIVAAIASAPDDYAREELAQAEAAILREIRRHHFPSPEEERIWEPPPSWQAGEGCF